VIAAPVAAATLAKESDAIEAGTQEGCGRVATASCAVQGSTQEDHGVMAGGGKQSGRTRGGRMARADAAASSGGIAVGVGAGAAVGARLLPTTATTATIINSKSISNSTGCLTTVGPARRSGGKVSNSGGGGSGKRSGRHHKPPLQLDKPVPSTRATVAQSLR
jgi:hypothetical protein